MNCISPPGLEDWQIVSYVDGEADDNVKEHIEKCSFCREKAASWEGIQRSVRWRLYRHTCPSPMELGEYQLGILAGPPKLIIAQHLRECPSCKTELTQLEEYLKEQALLPRLLEPVKVLFAQLIGGSRTNNGQTDVPLYPAFSGLRGESDEPFIYQADHIQIAIDVQDDTERPGCKILLGLITGLVSNGFMMEAYQEGKVVATTVIDEIGNFVFSHFLPGSYELILRGPDTEIRIQSFIV